MCRQNLQLLIQGVEFTTIISFVKHLHRCALAAITGLHQQPTLDEDK